MKRKSVFLLMGLLLFSVGVSAQSADDYVARVGRFMAGLGDNYRVRFVVDMEGMDSAKGELTVAKGNKYHIEVLGQELFSDGLYRYGVDALNMEVTIEGVDPESRNLLVNPLRAFDFSGDVYQVTLIGDSQEGGKNYKVLRLIPTDGVIDGVRNVVLYVEPTSGFPAELHYDFNGLEIIITVESADSLSRVKDSDYIFSAGNYPDYEIIDFR